MSGAEAVAPARARRSRKVCVVLPAFNEEARIGALLDRIDDAMDEARLDYAVVVVDDASRDRTRAIVEDRSRDMPIRVVPHAVNQGLGAAIRDGLMEAMQRVSGDDVVVTMDADDTHTPALILRMVRMIREGHDVVVASRYREGSRSIGVPRSRRLLSYGGSLLLRLVFPIPGVRDYTCGFRAYRASALHEALDRYHKHFLDQDGFEVMLDILLKLRHMKLIFGEVPFILRYDVKEGGTKMDVPRTIRRTLSLMVRRRLAR